MVGGGLWHPESTALAKLRASVDERPHRIRRVLTNPAFRETFLPGAKAGSEKAAVAAFAAANKENALKTKPKVCCNCRYLSLPSRDSGKEVFRAKKRKKKKL